MSYISLLIIFCITEYVMNKTLNPWSVLFWKKKYEYVQTSGLIQMPLKLATM